MDWNCGVNRRESWVIFLADISEFDADRLTKNIRPPLKSILLDKKEN